MKGGIVSVSAIIALVTFFSASAATGIDLGNYPWIFIDQYNENLVFVIGDYADVADAIGSIDVATSLQAASERKQPIGQALLASEIDKDSMQDYNIISIGGPCANPVTARLMGHPQNCNEGFIPGRAIVRLISNGDNLALVIAGATAIDTQRACRVMARYDQFPLTGKEANVEGTSLQDMIVVQR